jgi:N-acetylglucosamine kinase-like BadF-type ATPase
MPYYAGLDAGGTKTNCLIVDESGAAVGFGKAGPGNYEVSGTGSARNEIQRAFDAALRDANISADDLSAAGLGVAGADIEDDFVMLEREVIGPVFGGLRRDFKNDSAAALRGGTHNTFGVVIACGTGCVCAGRDEAGTFARVGGLGEDFGDICSGTSIGMDGLRAVFQARDGIIPATKLAGLFVERAGCADVEALFRAVYHQRITHGDLQPMAPLVFDAALAGDSIAYGILARGGAYLGAMVNAVARKLGLASKSFDVVMAGSVFKGSSPALVVAMAEVIAGACPKARPVQAVYEPVVGAALMAMDLDKSAAESTYGVLDESLRDIAARHGAQLKSG